MEGKKGKLILVTGGAGFIGSNFVRYLLNKGYHVVNLDLLTYAGNPMTIREFESAPNYSFVKGNICDETLVPELVKDIDTVVNFAAESHVDRSIADPSSFIRTDIFGTFNLLESVKKFNKRLVQISTDEVYGSLEQGSAVESSPFNPSSPYASSKAGADLLCLSYHKTFGTDVVVTRSSNNYGPYQYPEKLIPLFVTNALEDKPLPVYGDGMQKRDWLFVDDNCEAILLVMEKGVSGEAYNIGSNNEKTNIDVTKEILRLTGKPASLIGRVADRPGHDRRYSINSKKMMGLGWSAKTDFAEGLKKTVQWYIDNPKWWKPLKSGEFLEYYKAQYKGLL